MSEFHRGGGGGHLGDLLKRFNIEGYKKLVLTNV